MCVGCVSKLRSTSRHQSHPSGPGAQLVLRAPWVRYAACLVFSPATKSACSFALRKCQASEEVHTQAHGHLSMIKKARSWDLGFSSTTPLTPSSPSPPPPCPTVANSHAGHFSKDAPHSPSAPGGCRLHLLPFRVMVPCTFIPSSNL